MPQRSARARRPSNDHVVPAGFHFREHLVDHVAVANVHLGGDAQCLELLAIAHEIAAEFGPGFEQPIKIFFETNEVCINGAQTRLRQLTGQQDR